MTSRLILFLLTAGWTHSAEPLPLSSAYWRDPAFQKTFNGSYRIEARIEPSVSSGERALLIEVQTLMAKGNRRGALATLRSSPLTAGSSALKFNLGNLQFEEGLVEEAIDSYTSALKDYPSFRRSHRNLAMALVRQNELEPALEHLVEAVRLGDSEGATYGMLGYCRLQRGEWASALQAYRLAQISEPDLPEWKAGIAQCLQNLNARDEAAALLDEVIHQRPLEPSYALLQASLLLELGRSEDAVKALELPRRLATLDADGLLLLADLHLRADRRKSASDVMKTAFSLDGSPSIGRIAALAGTAMSLRDWSLASELLENAQAADESAPRPLKLISARLKIESGEAAEAGAAELVSLLKDDPADGEILIALGKYRAATGAPGEAELLFERATASESAAVDGWVELARIRVSQQRYREALEAVDQALALAENPTLENYRRELAALAVAAE
jgi:tetratricopeptide (TPR) repeat protein